MRRPPAPKILPPWKTPCHHFAMDYHHVGSRTLKQFRAYMATRLGATNHVIDIYSLGNKIVGEDTQLSRLPYMVPGALLTMRVCPIEAP